MDRTFAFGTFRIDLGEASSRRASKPTLLMLGVIVLGALLTAEALQLLFATDPFGFAALAGSL